VATDIAPFTFVEHEGGETSLLLTQFEPNLELFEEAGSPGPGYGWETVARYLVENVATDLEDRVDFDSEHSMFCAFSNDREALQALGARLARLFHNRKALASIIDAIGPRGFEII